MITEEQFQEMLSWSLDDKFMHTVLRIREFYEYYNGRVFVSWSGGLDSTVLAYIVRSEYPEVPLVFSDTGLEYPEIVAFVMSKIPDTTDYRELLRNGYPVRIYGDNIRIIKPKLTFREVINNYGYPVGSKQISHMVYTLRHPKPSNKASRNLYLTGEKSDGSFSPYYRLAEKWRKLIDAPFESNSYCCTAVKKLPFRNYMLLTKEYPIMGIRAKEGRIRKMSYKRTGCNNYGSKPKSLPLAIWTHQDILQFILDYDIDYCDEIYGEIREDEHGELYTTGAERTGCIYCMFGVHLESEPNRFQRLKQTHPQLWQYCMEELGLKEVLEYIGVPYE
jgi:3'-phosphoadenosine 5'-phosphosulfate sulfotransferase (PAPS reductase)/FAD synthetase